MISVQILVVETNNAGNNLVIAEVTKRFFYTRPGMKNCKIPVMC